MSTPSARQIVFDWIMGDPPGSGWWGTQSEVDKVDVLLLALKDTALPKSQLTWATDKPTVPGFYWWRFTERNPVKMYEVVFIYDKLQAREYEDFENLPKHGQWAGPILPPAEQEEA